MAEVIIAEVNGEASLVRGETGEQVNVTVGMTVAEGDVLNISPDGFVTVSVDGELRTLPAGQSVTSPKTILTMNLLFLMKVWMS